MNGSTYLHRWAYLDGFLLPDKPSLVVTLMYEDRIRIFHAEGIDLLACLTDIKILILERTDLTKDEIVMLLDPISSLCPKGSDEDVDDVGMAFGELP